MLARSIVESTKRCNKLGTGADFHTVHPLREPHAGRGDDCVCAFSGPAPTRHRRRMINIPTELLRTFVAVVDLRSFTRAAQSLGITQPAVSAQVKRLQQLLGGELLDKSAPGVLLTAMGESVLGSA